MRAGDIGFEAELRFSPKWVLGFLWFIGIAVVVIINPRLGLSEQIRVVLAGGALIVVSATAWWLADRLPWASRWLTVIIVAATIYVGSNWVQTEALLSLLIVPTALAATLISFPAAVLTGALGTGLVLLSRDAANGGADSHWPVIIMTAIWCTVAVMRGVTYHTHRVAQWSWDTYQTALHSLEEIRGRRAALEQTSDELAFANRQLALANERVSALRLIAEEAERARGEFVARVSHEFRTPLNMVIGMVGLMVENPEVYSEELPPDVQMDLEIVHHNGRHLLSMINDVLDLSQADAGRLVLHRELVRLSEIVDSALTVVRPLVEKKRLWLHVDVAGDLPVVDCDPTRIRQVILNLVSNAARFTDAGGITVQAVQRDRQIALSVTDTGPGIPAEDAETIFEPFSHRSDTLFRDTDGSGLGLSISKRFIELHGGRMWVESELGAGSRFLFELPIRPPPGHAARAGHQIREDWVWRERAFRTDRAIAANQLVRPRVIVWDQTGALLRELAHVSDSDEVEFVRAGDGDQVLRELDRCPAHAVMVNLATTDGLWRSLEDLRQRVSDTPVLGCSVRQPADRAIEAGALGHLVKPITRLDLQKAIDAVGRPVRRVLVVDDDPEALHLIGLMLTACDGGLEVARARSGAQALEELSAAPVDLVLLDLVMAGLDGWQVLKRIREGTTRGIPVYLVSAQDPANEPALTRYLVATSNDGLPISKLLRCSLAFSSLLLTPEQVLDQGPQ
jgi:signal transduction histidine kinase/CheY-like chemotaxis protein